MIVLIELCYLLIVALSPFPQLGLSASPITLAWTWTLLPSQILGSMLGSTMIHRWVVPSLLGLTLLGLLATYAYGILSIHKATGTIGFNSLRLFRIGRGRK